jgi:F5/8 type C domain
MARISAWASAAILALVLGGLHGCFLINLEALDVSAASIDAAGSRDASDSAPMADADEPDAVTPAPDGSGDGSPLAYEAGAKDAPSESESSTMAEASADVSSPSEPVGCASGTPLARGAWATNPGTTASDDVCGAGDGIFNMFDGLLTTRWSTNRVQATSPPEWLEIDLGCPQTFSELVLDATDDPVDYPRGYTVQVSSDATTWSQVSTGAGSTALTSITFPPTTARYLKILQTGASNTFWSIDELYLCGTTAGTCAAAPTAYPRSGWATNPGTSATDDMADLGNMFDGSLSTRWTTNRAQVAAPPEWVEVDMGVSQPFSEVTLENFVDCEDYPRTYTLQASTDNSTWTQLATGAGSTPFTTIPVSITTARYIKITQTGANATNFWSIDELLVLHP